MKFYQPRIIAKLLFFLPFSALRGQEKPADSVIYHQAITQVVSYYNQFRGGATTGLYNGVEQQGYFYFIEGTAFFGNGEWQKGSIFYDGILYPDVTVKYDQVKDLLLIPHPNGYTAFSLFSPRVSYFTLPGHRFLYLQKREEADPPDGFYELLEEGNVTLVARRTKKINENILAADQKPKFEEIYTYYIQKEGKYYLVKNESYALDLLKEKKPAIQKMLKKEKIKYRKNRELALIRMVRLYNQI